MKELMSHLVSVRTIFVIVVIVIGAAAGTMAQSGRSIPKQRQSIPAATPEPTSHAKPRPTPEFTVKVIADIQPNAYFAFPKPENMLAWAIERLRKTSLLHVQDGGFANRRDAINQAEKETADYVVLLQLEDNDFGRPDIAGRPAAGQVWIFLSVLSPGNGRAKYTRKITLNEELRNSKIPPPIVRNCHPGIFGNDALLLEASIKAAEYVMSSFNIPIPPDCPR